MFASLRALLTGIIDYAGLFPPAGLRLDQAIGNYARYREEREGWMLARFVCPATRLAELAPLVEERFDSRRPLHFAALASPAGMAATLAAVDRFRERLGARVVGDAIESRLAEAEISWPNLEENNLVFFFESAGENKEPAVVAALSAASGPSSRLGFKLRCGGLEAPAFPTPEQVAFAIAACRDARIPLKFTAGLHHPLRHFDAALQTPMHGFINVFVAGVLAQARGLSAEQLRPILADEDASDFVFAEDGLRWKDHRASTEEIARVRQHGVVSFGSCSFDEPRDDLRKLGWM